MDVGDRAGVRLIDDHELVGVALKQALTESAMLRYLGRVGTVDEALV